MKNTISLNKNRDFRRLYGKGKCIPSPTIVVYCLKNNLGYRRMGITAGKSFKTAVLRNRARRLVREAFRLCEDKLPLSYDYVIVARGKILTEGCQAVISDLLNSIKNI